MKALIAAAGLLTAGLPAVSSAADFHGAAITQVQWRHDGGQRNGAWQGSGGQWRGGGQAGRWNGGGQWSGGNRGWRGNNQAWGGGGNWRGGRYGDSGYRFYRGGYFGPAYRNYVVRDYWRWRLHRPPYGYYWYRYGDEYILAAIATGLIAEVVAADAYDNGYYDGYGY